jgi:hypothetical protein
MPPFRRVEGEEAGPEALGILIPPGHRTLVILRPRALAWDLLLLSPLGDQLSAAGFWEIRRAEAGVMARKVERALEEWAGGGKGGSELVPLAGEEGFRVRVVIGSFRWMVCRRVPGRPYQPWTFAAAADAHAAAAELADVLCPDEEDGQELYCNTLHFYRK